MATAIDGTELYQQAIARIRELEAEVERMRNVVDAAWIAVRFGKGTSELGAALRAYEASKPQMSTERNLWNPSN